jgi:hypothetical protein
MRQPIKTEIDEKANRITGGRVSFSRVVQAQQFEPKKAEVELTFTIPEGENLDDTLDEVAQIVQDKVFEMVGLRKKTSPV